VKLARPPGGANSSLPAGPEPVGEVSPGAPEGGPDPIHIPVSELAEPLLGARLRTRYQPIVRLSDRTAIGLEILARLDHPAHGTVSPEHFVPQMEDAGLSRELMEAVSVRAFAEFGTHIGQLGLSIALNMPRDILLHAETLPLLERRRLEAGVPADRIVIELTESQPVAALSATGFDALGEAVLALRRLGYGVAIDDVAPDMARHRELLALGFSILKFDKSVVADSADHPGAASFLTATTAAAHDAGMLVIAEGVKDKETWNRMIGFGVDEAQGFLISRPLPAQGVPVWLEGWTHQGTKV
jgi:EAL domain-containing protein (putative c-di-GMP-specific phosphodiesterase class I)